MNFLTAIKHAAIGYGIRRGTWQSDAILHLDNLGELRWVGEKRKFSWAAPPREPDEVAGLIDNYDELSGVSTTDILAKDWETV